MAIKKESKSLGKLLELLKIKSKTERILKGTIVTTGDISNNNNTVY